MALLSAEPAIPSEKLSSLALYLEIVRSVIEDVQRPRDPAQRGGIAIEPALGPGQLQHQTGISQPIVTNQPSGRG